MKQETLPIPNEDESLIAQRESEVRSEVKNIYDRLIEDITRVVKDPLKISFYVNLLKVKAKALDDGYFYGRILYKLTESEDFEATRRRVMICIEKISECVELANSIVNTDFIEEKYFKEFNQQIPRNTFFEGIPKFMESEQKLIEELKQRLTNCSLDDFRRFIAEFCSNNSHNFGTAIAGLRTYFLYDDPELY